MSPQTRCSIRGKAQEQRATKSGVANTQASSQQYKRDEEELHAAKMVVLWVGDEGQDGEREYYPHPHLTSSVCARARNN